MTDLHPKCVWSFGMLAIGGALAAMVADVLSLWVAETGVEFVLLNREISWRLFVLLSQKSSMSLLAGSLLGIVALPLHMCGFYLMAVALEPAGKRRAWGFFAAACFLAAVGSGFHGSIALVGEAARAEVLDPFLKMMDLWIPWWWMMTGGFLAVSAALAWMILFSRTRYPRWALWVSPMSAVLFGLPFLWILTELGAPFGLVWLLAICGINLPLLVFHAVTLWVLLKAEDGETSQHRHSCL